MVINKAKIIEVFVFISILMLSGCQQSEELDTVLLIPPSITKDTRTISAFPPPTQESSKTQTPEPSIDLVPPMPGLLYCSEDVLWAVNDEGKSNYIVPDCSAFFSPDRRYAIFDGFEDHYVIDLYTGETIIEFGFWDSENDPNMKNTERLYGATWSSDSKMIFYYSFKGNQTDVWVIDIISGIKKNLTNTQTLIEGWPRLFDGDRKLLFSSKEKGDDNYFSFGRLTSMNIDGSDYQVQLADESGYFRISPDGNSGALFYASDFNCAKVFNKEFEVVEHCPYAIGEYRDLSFILYEPEWSPDSKKIAWSMEISLDQTEYDGIGIHDFENNSILFLYPYLLLEGEGFPAPPEWSPDNAWITINAPHTENNTQGIYVIAVDGSDKHFYEGFDNAIWLNGMDRVILNTGNISGPSMNGAWIAELDNWTMMKIDLPTDSVVIGFVDPVDVNNWIGFDKNNVYWQE